MYLGKLLKSPTLLYKMMDFEQKRRFLKSMVENFVWNEGNLDMVWKKPFDLVAERSISNDGSATGSRTPLPSLKTRCPNR